ncbi:Bifunctional 5,10-methylene-tetrahydrofolate dehydrogenase [Helicobacter ailurogastricus]|uniref:bifunctional methylenetetrahydrofolate dehydrogenase/methenyltetrahydrofolate cyclohydrolase FolD n=1 Tax=Helicobacter ailurogastricus TaxID=1578720 RepID=UPI00244D8084|nr:bifunctional methylenetetrahydrofolate dehydrogenase/methenyltetrahydrofolate cyclohydrolase FolD [Helicobacter ailurogastricus]GMB89798.1 Bifunctional 5,10-methylene-tetrahydrofolate dehydrogenase [Helicobacter ailurogastricus]GMB90936.1 Bifunctional 5,10-methylene-tetrahydrofolate dehydrogenase [Helicobacter ailurogastricus]
MVLLDGYTLARLKEEALRHEIQTLQQTLQFCPKLVVILVGTDNASVLYVNMKAKACARVGIDCVLQTLSAQTSQKELLNLLDAHNRDPSVHGILVQLPLPKHIDTRRVIEAIDPRKDVDGFHPLNVGRVYSNSLYTGFLPATAMGVMQLLEHYNIEVKGKDVAIVGASNIIGKPLASLMLNAGATISLCHILTKDISLYTKKADIVCVGVGQPKLLKADMVKEGAVVVDIGINKVEGKIVGDADFEGLKDKVNFITPVPRGVGPMTIACLLQNTLHAAKGCA